MPLKLADRLLRRGRQSSPAPEDAILKMRVRERMERQARWLDAELELLSRREQEQRRE